MNTLLECNIKKRKTIQSYLKELIGFFALLLLVAIISLISPQFIAAGNINNLLTDLSPLLITGCGMTFVLLTGAIDLSVGAICSCSAVILTLFIQGGMGVLAYLIAMLFGLFAGLINGFLFTKVKMPSFITTLGTMSMWNSVALLISGGMPLQIKPAYYSFINWSKVKFMKFLPLMFIIAVIVLIIMYVVQRYTKLGKYVYAIGANERATYLAGINIDRAKIMSFVLCGGTAALTGIFLSAKLKSGIPTVGDQLVLQVVAAVALGGTSLSGGKGNVLYALLGCLIVTVIRSGMNIVGIDPMWQQVFFGMLVIAAVSLTVDRSGRDRIIK